MGQNAYPSNSGLLPLVVAPFSTDADYINVTDSFTITNFLVNIQVTAPDEGSGADPSLVGVVVAGTTIPVSVSLHNFTADSIANVTYDTDRAPASGSLNSFDGYNSVDQYFLYIDNMAGVNCTLTAWTIYLSFNDPPSIPLVPTAPSALSVPGNIKYGAGISNKKNVNCVMNLLGAIAITNIIDKVQYCPFAGKLNNFVVTCKNTGTTQATKLSVYKVSNGVVTRLINQNLQLLQGSTYAYMNFRDQNSNLFSVAQGDIIYASIDQVGTGVQDLSLKFNLSEN